VIIDGYYGTWERETRSGYLAGDEFGAEQMLQAMDVAGVDIAMSCPLGQAIPDPEHRQRVEGGNLAALPSLEPGRMTSADRRDLA